MNINGGLMSKDTEIAVVRNGHVSPTKEALLPFHLKRHDDFVGWLNARAIDSHRVHARLLKKSLRLTGCTDAEIVLWSSASVITDTYWFKPDGNMLSYEDVRFKQNPYDMLALAGDFDALNIEPQPTPELTNIGSFEKAWRLIDGQWWLYKEGKPKELFSELFIFQLGKRLGYPMATYELADGYIRSPDFTHGASVNYESAWGLVDNDKDYSKSYIALSLLSPKAADDYLAMIALDTICFNADRHTQNYGILRNVTTGDVIGLAPNYDNNIALIAAVYGSTQVDENDLLIQSFIDFLKDTPLAMSTYNSKWHRHITSKIINDCINQVPIEVDRPYIVEFVRNRAARIEQLLA